MNRQNWSSEEDSTLIYLVQKSGVSDWTLIASNLRTNCSGCTRSGKQCRQRWYNHLTPTVNKKSWEFEQQTKLFTLHRVYGNKWKDIAKEIKGRTDNDIKNHFYSTLRRSLRRLNKIIGEKNSTSQIRQIKPSVLTTIMNFIYKHEKSDDEILLSSLKQLPLLILQFATFKPKKTNVGMKLNEDAKFKIQTILSLVAQFNKSYANLKKKPIKQINSNKKCKQKIVKQQYLSENNDSIYDRQNFLSQQRQAQNHKILQIVKTEAQITPHYNQKNVFQYNEQNKFMMLDPDSLPIMNHLDEPSASEDQVDKMNLVIIGKHISPSQMQGNQQEQMDEIFQMNFDNN